MVADRRHLFVDDEVAHRVVVETPGHRLEGQGEDPDQHQRDLRMICTGAQTPRLRTRGLRRGAASERRQASRRGPE
jgi:hypothetical protein